jgi:hypothetical protein
MYGFVKNEKNIEEMLFSTLLTTNNKGCATPAMVVRHHGFISRTV